MSVSLRLVTLNIERAKHLERVLPFLSKQNPEVACLQEVREPDIALLKESINAGEHIFAPMTRHPSDGNPAVVGTCIISRLPIRTHNVEYYRGNPDLLSTAIAVPEESRDNAAIAAGMNCGLTSVDIEKDRVLFRIATTHFTWSAEGNSNDYQREDMQKLLKLLEKAGEFVLASDFNAPRGGEIFSMLAEKYKDNVPPHYLTSLDASLHRSGKTRPEELANKMVDGIFSTPGYNVSDVEMVCGLSDHCALIANISRSA